MALSPSEFEKLKRLLQQSPVKSAPEPNYFERVGSDFMKRGQDVVNAVEAGATGKQNLLSTGLQTAGAFAGGALDIVNEGVSSVLKQTGLDKPVGQFVSSVSETSPIQSAVSFYQSLSPEKQKNLDSIFNIASVLAGGKLSPRLTPKGTLSSIKKSIVGTTPPDGGGGGGGGIKGATQGVVTKIQDKITPITEGTTTVLKKNPVEKLDRYLRQAKEAVADYSKPTPLELAGNQAQSALKSIQAQLNATGELKSSVTKSIGNTIDASDVIKTGLNDLRDSLNRFGVSLKVGADGEIGFVRMAGREVSLPATDLRIAKEFVKKLSSLKSGGFQRVDDTIDYLQKFLYQQESAGKLTIPVDKQISAALKSTLGKMNSGLKEKAGARGYKDYAKLNEQYARQTSIRNKLNKSLGIEGNKGAALMKQLFSPTGTAPRKLFMEVEDLTGIDLVTEATLAKFVMENIGDARQASLLEEVIRGRTLKPTGLIGKAAERVINKLQDPVAKARRISGAK